MIYIKDSNNCRIKNCIFRNSNFKTSSIDMKFRKIYIIEIVGNQHSSSKNMSIEYNEIRDIDA